ncbi:cytochrome-c peroxidase [Magnetospira sp. QH-2]|uniref:cytochrome-c peroxidase n=1 Tax=Magnetospira sp. (strain QH-2) TaxID=1288970 RepID=UPI0011DD0850|nr:cytochrome c peroxidase [Magnetospira sp. QH-2]
MARLVHPPLGLPPLDLAIGDAEKMAERIALGRKLFFDRRLSINGTMSCAMCHIPEQGFAQHELATSVGVEGRSVRRNAPTILNVAYMELMFHDGRDDSLETQIFGPLLAQAEMANPSVGFVLQTIRQAKDYDGLFESAYGEPVDFGHLGSALAAYERSLLLANSPFDRWFYGKQDSALTDQAKKGFALFTGKAGCAICHPVEETGTVFTDQQLHNTGLGYLRDIVDPSDQGPVAVQVAPGVVYNLARSTIDSVGLPRQKDLGRKEVTNDPDDMYLFKTPGLRNVALTAPYMHDGSLRRLRDVVDFYDQGGFQYEGTDPALRPLHLTEPEKKALVAFLESLTGEGIADLIAEARGTEIGNVEADLNSAKGSY